MIFLLFNGADALWCLKTAIRPQYVQPHLGVSTSTFAIKTAWLLGRNDNGIIWKTAMTLALRCAPPQVKDRAPIVKMVFIRDSLKDKMLFPLCYTDNQKLRLCKNTVVTNLNLHSHG